VTGPVDGERAAAVARNEGIVSTVDDAVNTLVVLPESVSLPAAQVKCPAGLTNVPARRGLFVGRAGALARLESPPAGGVAVHAVLGPAGAGKSALAARWAAARSDCSPTWWITASTRTAIDAGLADLAVALEPFLAALPATELRERAVDWLAAHDGWLLVLDDVSDPRDVRDLAARIKGGRLVVTSRRTTGWDGIAATMPLDVLAEDEAVALLRSILPATGLPDTGGAAELCRALGCLPLAVEQASAWIAQAAVTPRAYLDLLARYPAAIRAATPEGWPSSRTDGCT
jgi:hypothetical protein